MRGHDVAARIELVTHRGARVVAVGRGGQAVDGIALLVLHLHFALGTQTVEEEVVLPQIVFLVQAELGVDVFRAGVAVGGCETEFARTRPSAVVGRIG